MNKTQTVILVCKPRLLREILVRAIAKSDMLEIIKQVNDLEDLPEELENQPVDWVIFLVNPGQDVPPLVDAAIATHPTTRFVAMNADGAHFKMRWLEPHEYNLDDANLVELTKIFPDFSTKKTINRHLIYRKDFDDRKN